MQTSTIDFITSLDGYGAAAGWPGWWGLESPEYMEWLEHHPDATAPLLMGTTTPMCDWSSSRRAPSRAACSCSSTSPRCSKALRTPERCGRRAFLWWSGGLALGPVVREHLLLIQA